MERGRKSKVKKTEGQECVRKRKGGGDGGEGGEDSQSERRRRRRGPRKA